MVKYKGFDSNSNATVGDFVASLIFRLLISAVFVLFIIFIPFHNIKCLFTLFYLIYITFNIIPIAKSVKLLFWDSFVKEDEKIFSNTMYFRMGFQIVETIINYGVIFALYTFIL